MFYIYANNNPYNNEKKDLSKDVISKAIDVLLDSGVELSTLFNQDGLLKQLSKRLVEKALE